MNYRRPFFKFSLLTLTFSSAALVLFKVLFFPAKVHSNVISFTFPEQVTLPGWQLASTQALTGENINDSLYISGQRYHYLKQDIFLDIEMHYFVNTDGDTGNFLKSRIPTSQLQNQQRKGSENGYYNLFLDQEKAYLSACINPYGGSTVTDMQFKQNRNIYDISPRFFFWLSGRGKIQDNRCLWAYLSTPHNQSSIENTYQTLERAWVPWHQWWSKHFPKP